MMIKTIAATSIALIICASAVWYFAPKFLEQPAYSVLKKEGSIEVRAYEQMLLQSVAVSGDQYDALRNGFRPLVRYIGAKERDGEKISMTAPVMQILDDTKQEWIVSFSMPSKYNEDSLPNSNNNMVFIEVVPPTVTAVIRFSGRANADLLGRKTAELMNWIDKQGYVAKEKPRYMFYNDPSTPPFLRRNEVMIAVQ
jgi:hypothetical protein